jgi:hypothetical protein
MGRFAAACGVERGPQKWKRSRFRAHVEEQEWMKVLYLRQEAGKRLHFAEHGEGQTEKTGAEEKQRGRTGFATVSSPFKSSMTCPELREPASMP